MKRYYPYLMLLCVPLLYLTMSFYLMEVQGPNWIMTPNDHGYYDIFNGLNLITSKPLGRIFYPGVPNIILAGVVIKTVHFFCGTTDIVTDVLNNPELYQSVFQHCLVVIVVLSMFISGVLVHSATKNIIWGILFQTSPFLLRLFNHILAIGGGFPESFQLASGLLLAAIAISLLRYASSSELSVLDGGKACVPWHRYTVYFAVLLALCITSKITALPLAVFPMVLLPGFARKLFFVFMTAVSSLLIMLPIDLCRLFSCFRTRWAQIGAEHIQRSGASSFISRTIDGLERLFLGVIWSGGAPVFLILLLISICFCLIVLVLRRYHKIHINPMALRLILATTACLICAAWFVANRPLTHYLFAFIGLSGLNMIMIFVVVSDSINSSKWRKGKWIVSHILPCLILLLFVWVRVPDFYRSVKGWGQIKDDAISLNKMLDDKYKEAAKINTPHTDTPWWALVMSDFNAGKAYNNIIADIIPPDVYFYQWDGVNYYNAAWWHFDIKEIASRHKGVVFYGSPFEETRRSITGKPGRYVEPVNLTLGNISRRGLKRIAEVDEISLEGKFLFGPSKETKVYRTSEIVWEKHEGFPQWLEVDFSPDVYRPVITKYELKFKNWDTISKVPKSWQLQGSNDGLRWDVLDVRKGQYNWRLEGVFFLVPQDFGTVNLNKPEFVESRPQVHTVTGTLADAVKFARLNRPTTADAPRVKYIKPGRYWSGRYDIFLFKGCYYAIPHTQQSLLNWTEKDVASMDGVFTADTKKEILEIIEEIRTSMAAENYTTPPLCYVESDDYYNIIQLNSGNAFAVQKPGAYRYYRLYVKKGADPKCLRIDGVRFLTPTKALYGKSQAVLPNDMYVYDYNCPDKKSQVSFGNPYPFFEKSGSFPVCLEVDLGEDNNKAVHLYSLRSGPPEHKVEERMPRDWAFQGSEDGKTWITLDMQKDQSDWEANEEREYIVEQSGEYRYYRLLINAVYAASTPGIVRLYEWKLFSDTQIQKPLKVYYSKEYPFDTEKRQVDIEE